MAKNFLVLAILCTSLVFLSLGVNADETNHSKKTKRAIEVDNNNYSSHNLKPNVPADNSESNDVPSKYNNLGTWQLLSAAKRAPSGFTGMRGKKQQEYTDLSPNDLDWVFDDDYAYKDIRNKKAPSGFYGVRGKKVNQYDYERSLMDQLLRRLYQDTYSSSEPVYSLGHSPVNDELEHSLEKRSPPEPDMNEGRQSPPYQQMNKRGQNAFYAVRGKREFKRSPMQQLDSSYFGMRGKKEPGFLGFRNKFVGVRGKKNTNGAALNWLKSQVYDIPVNNYRSSARYLIDSPEFLTLKRTPNGFLGMRGKRPMNTGALENDL